MRAGLSFRFYHGLSASAALSREISRLSPDLRAGTTTYQGGSGRVRGLIDLLDFFPTHHGSVLAYSKMIRECRKAFAVEKEDEGVPPLNAGLSDDEMNRRRYFHSWSKSANGFGIFHCLGPRWGSGLSLYLYLLPDAAGKWLRRTLSDIGLFQSRSSTGVAKGLKILSDTMKKQGDLISSYWRYAVNLETLGGYRPSLPMNTFIPELRKWLSGDVAHEYPFKRFGDGEQTFLHYFRQGIESFLNKAPSVESANLHALSLSEYVADPSNWASSGSTQVKKVIRIELDGKLHKLERNKTTTGLLLEPSEVLGMILSKKHDQVLRPIEKLESGKVRAVVNADDTIYLKMAYVSNWLERALAGHPQSTLFMRPEQRMQMWQSLAQETRTSSTKIPLDQSHFDWQPNKRMLAVVLACIRDFVEKHCTVDAPTMVNVIDSIFYTLVTSRGTVEITEVGTRLNEIRSIRVEKGVASGWRWTALIDTLCNVGELFAAAQLAAEWGFPDAVTSFIAQGDDDQVRSPSFSHATALASAYASMNFEINPGKFFIDTRRDEFLRLVPLPDRIVGYPARAINNILWRNPINPDPLPGELSLKSQLSQWLLCINRGLSEDRCLRCMLQDMNGRSKLGKQDIVDFLLTPAPYGGCGLVGTKLSRSRYVSISQSQIRRSFKVVTHLPGLRDIQSTAMRMSIPQKVVEDSVLSVLPLGRIRGTVTSPEVREVNVSFAKPAKSHEGWVPTAYAMDDSVPFFLRSTYTRKLVQSRDWDTLKRLCHPTVLPWFVQFFEHLTLSAFEDWCLGRLDTNGPTVLGYSPEQVSVHWSRIVSGILASCLLRNRVSRDYLRAVATSSVQTLLSELRLELPLSG